MIRLMSDDEARQMTEPKPTLKYQKSYVFIAVDSFGQIGVHVAQI